MINNTKTPAIYVLIRIYKLQTNNDDNEPYYSLLEKAICSVEENAVAYNGSVKIVANEDTPKDDVLYPEHKRRVLDILERHHFSIGKSNLFFSETDGKGSSYATLIVRESFLLWSEANDDYDSIAVTLDQDDELKDNALANIAYEMLKTKANICISAYETEDYSNLSIIKDNGKNHNEAARRLYLKPQTITKEGDSAILTHIDTLGWTKSWSRQTMMQYLNCLKTFMSRFRGSAEAFFSKHKAYEDFIDTFILLNKYVKLCGVPSPTHKYKKHPFAITSTPTISAFRDDRTACLIALNDLTHYYADHLSNSYEILLRHFFSFKIKVIEGILADYRSKYSNNGDIRYQEFAKMTDPGYFIKKLCIQANATKTNSKPDIENDDYSHSFHNLASLYLCNSLESHSELVIKIGNYLTTDNS
uniref:hypothetical protein n=1 Tax=Candidatus Cryptobacteroides bacterium TaxID=3085639 RepID=UPI0040294F0E